MADKDMSDLFHGGSLITTRLSDYARERYEQALWYVWGRQDAGDSRTRNKVAGHYLGDDFAFGEYAALQAEAFHRQYEYMLRNIHDQYDEFLKLHNIS